MCTDNYCQASNTKDMGHSVEVCFFVAVFLYIYDFLNGLLCKLWNSVTFCLDRVMVLIIK